MVLYKVFITSASGRWSFTWSLSLEFAKNCKIFVAEGREPWSSGYGRRLMFHRSWVLILAPYTGYLLVVKFAMCIRKDENKWKKVGPFLKKNICCRTFDKIFSDKIYESISKQFISSNHPPTHPPPHFSSCIFVLLSHLPDGIIAFVLRIVLSSLLSGRRESMGWVNVWEWKHERERERKRNNVRDWYWDRETELKHYVIEAERKTKKKECKRMCYVLPTIINS